MLWQIQSETVLCCADTLKKHEDGFSGNIFMQNPGLAGEKTRKGDTVAEKRKNKTSTRIICVTTELIRDEDHLMSNEQAGFNVSSNSWILLRLAAGCYTSTSRKPSHEPQCLKPTFVFVHRYKDTCKGCLEDMRPIVQWEQKCTGDNFHMNLLASAGWMSNGALWENAKDPEMTSTIVCWEATSIDQTVCMCRTYSVCAWGCLVTNLCLLGPRGAVNRHCEEPHEEVPAGHLPLGVLACGPHRDSK